MGQQNKRMQTVKAQKAKYTEKYQKRKPTEPKLKFINEKKDVIVARDIVWELKVYKENICKLGSVVYMAIILGVAEGILGSKDRIPFDVLAA